MNFDSYSNNFEVTSQYNFDVGPSSTGSNFDDKEPFSNSSLNSGESIYFDWFTSNNSNVSDGSSLNNFNNDQHFMPKFFMSTSSSSSNFQPLTFDNNNNNNIYYNQQQQQQQQTIQHYQQQHHQHQQQRFDSIMEIEQLKAPETLFNLDEINQDQEQDDEENTTIEIAELDDDGDNSDDEFNGQSNNNNNNNMIMMGNLPASKTPCLDATAYCAELNLGAERVDPFNPDIIKITNFNIFIENLKKICPKQNQTQNDEARIKALRRWFD